MSIPVSVALELALEVELLELAVDLLKLAPGLLEALPSVVVLSRYFHLPNPSFDLNSALDLHPLFPHL